jgi:hypothetical protein
VCLPFHDLVFLMWPVMWCDVLLRSNVVSSTPCPGVPLTNFITCCIEYTLPRSTTDKLYHMLYQVHLASEYHWQTLSHVVSSTPCSGVPLTNFIANIVFSLFNIKGPSWSWLYGSWIYNYLNMQSVPIATNIVNLKPAQARCPQYNMW